MTRIADKFAKLKTKKGKGFIPYIMAGDPDLEHTRQLILELEQAGADIIELGVPFSDPMADGPVIQRASERALRNGTTVRDCLNLVRQVREQSEVPIVVMSYLNPLLSLGEARIAAELRDAGVDGMLVTDLVPEEAGKLIAQARAVDLDTVFLIAPTSTDGRIERVADASSGFVYAVSRAGVTGVRDDLSKVAEELVIRARRFTDLPIAVGFGISTPAHVRAVWEHADAAAVGSRLVAEIERYGSDPSLVDRVGRLARELVTG